MNAFKIAWILFKNNFKLYHFYLTVLILTIAIYYNFLAINFNPYMSVVNEQYGLAKTASILCSGILFFTVISFMTHANNFFYKGRYKEVGTYMLMGIKESKIGRVFAVESMMLGGIAVAIGLPVGILFSKLFFMLLSKAMMMNTQIPFYIPVRAISTLLLIFGGIIVLLGFKNYWTVKRSKLIDMLNAAKKEQSIPKMKWVRGILGIICIGTGYVLALNMVEWKLSVNTILGVFILECVGTYLFFGSFLGIILFECTKNKKLIYKGSRLISFNNTLFRLGSHYRSFAMSAILSAATVGAFSMSLSLKDYASGHVLIEAPYSISYMNENETVDNKIKQIIKESTHQITKENQSHFIKGEVSYKNGEEKVTKKCLITSYSEIQKTLEVTEFKNYKKILEQIRPSEGEVINILRAKTLISLVKSEGNTYSIKGQSYKLKKQIKLPFIGDMPDIGQYETYVVTDKVYHILKQNEEELTLKGINFTHPEDSLELVEDLAKIIPNRITNLNSYMQQYEYKYYVIGVFYFLGLVMAIVFMIATFSTIYFKILSDSLLDRQQYKMLMKIGMNKDEITKSIYTQVGIAFVLPTLIGCVHSIFAIKTLETFLHYNFIKSISIGVSIFIIVMIIFYIFITKKYRDKVYEG